MSGEFVAEVTYTDVRWYTEPNCLPESLATPPLGAMYTVTNSSCSLNVMIPAVQRFAWGFEMLRVGDTRIGVK